MNFNQLNYDAEYDYACDRNSCGLESWGYESFRNRAKGFYHQMMKLGRVEFVLELLNDDSDADLGPPHQR